MNNKKNNMFLPIPPGTSLKEQMEVNNVSEKELADELGFSSEKIKFLLTGKKIISDHTAMVLEKMNMCPVSFWKNLELNYRKQMFNLPSDFEDDTGIVELYEYSFFEDYIKENFRHEYSTKEKNHDNTTTCDVFMSSDKEYTVTFIIESSHDMEGSILTDETFTFVDSSGTEIHFNSIEDVVQDYFFDLLCGRNEYA